MKSPKLVLFDFGGTLAEDGELDIAAGIEAVLREVGVKDYDKALLTRLWKEMHMEIENRDSTPKGYHLETPLSAIFRNIFTRAGIKIDLPSDRAEYIFDKYNSSRRKTPYIEDLLEALYEKGIRTAVISNIVMTGASLRMAIDELLPENKFEFVITSADYLFMKPAPDMFEAAAKLAGVSPGDCWYLGDTLRADVRGSSPVGMTAVRYCFESEKDFEELTTVGYDGKEYKYYQVNSWKVLEQKVRQF